MATVGTKQELNKLLEQRASKVLDSATQKILELFQKEYIRKLVYDSHGLNKFYERTWEFYKSWEWTIIKRQANKLTTQMFYNYEKNMPTFSPDDFIHGSHWSRPKDIRHNLMDILNKKGYSSKARISVYRPSAYWDVFISDMFQGGKLGQIIDEEFVKAGFKRA